MLRLLATVLLFAPPLEAQTPQSSAAAAQQAKVAKRLAGLLEESGFKYRKADDALWVVSFRGQHLDPVDVLVQARADMVVLYATARKKPNPTAEQMRQLLQASYNANYSKLGIDDDGDLLALTELATDVSPSALRSAVDEVASLADTAAGLTSGTAHAPTSTEDYEAIPVKAGATMPLVRGAFELVYDPQKWKAQATPDPNTTQLVHASGEAWVKVIAERLQMKPDGLRELALTNAAELSPRLVSETWRTSNGLRVLVLRYEGTRSGINFTFYNQLFSDQAGLVQIAGWTASNLFEEHRHDLRELFAGFRKVRR